ncbi:protein-export protein SecB [Nitrosomonas stercoris]|uniref:Protein-export protein SecB n=1 Tax=Nitrosomonas stercoris TaxID=1444684 RepID=A0A4Y1YNE7_9PROT|nr:protein-export protein SecB [Nitrosomonas stercoris]
MAEPEQQQQPVFVIEKVYIKDLSLEVPHAPQIFLERESPDINVQLATSGKIVEGEIREVTVTATVTARLKEKDQIMFLVEAHQAGIFRIQNVPENEIEPVLNVLCPNIVFPYLREAISDAVTRAGFPPVILNPVNFEAMYRQRKQQETAESQSDPAVDGATKH